MVYGNSSKISVCDLCDAFFILQYLISIYLRKCCKPKIAFFNIERIKLPMYAQLQLCYKKYFCSVLSPAYIYAHSLIKNVDTKPIHEHGSSTLRKVWKFKNDFWKELKKRDIHNFRQSSKCGGNKILFNIIQRSLLSKYTAGSLTYTINDEIITQNSQSHVQ